MFLFNRSVLYRGDIRKIRPYTESMTQVVRDVSGISVSLWAGMLGGPIGTMVYSALVHDRAEFDGQVSAMGTDARYLDKVAEGLEYVATPPEDTMIAVMHTAGAEYQRADVGAIVLQNRAQIAGGHAAEAFRWSTEMADLISSITGATVMFGPTTAGPFGEVAWVTTSPDMATYASRDELVNKDPRYYEKLGEMGEMFLPGSGMRYVARRIA